MIIRRLALFIAMLSGLATTQMPEYWQQYRQRLEGAIGELTRVVAKFDADAENLGMTRAAGLVHMKQSPDPLVRSRAVAMEQTIARLGRLKRADAAFNNPNLIDKWWTLATTLDPGIAAGAYETYQPAVPTTFASAIAGLIGFIIGGGLVHLLGLPIRYRHKIFKRRRSVAADAPSAQA